MNIENIRKFALRINSSSSFEHAYCRAMARFILDEINGVPIDPVDVLRARFDPDSVPIKIHKNKS